MNISFSESGLSDLEDIKQYYLEQGVPHIGQEIVTSIFSHVQTLSDHPEIGRIVPEFGEERIREIIHSPFRIVYLRDTNSIQIIRVWRSERLLSLSGGGA